MFSCKYCPNQGFNNQKLGLSAKIHTDMSVQKLSSGLNMKYKRNLHMLYKMAIIFI